MTAPTSIAMDHPTAATAGLSVELHRDLAGVEDLWRGMEGAPGVVASPYQRFDWVAAHSATLGAADGSEPAIVVCRGGGGRPRLLLPLCVRRERGCRVARFIGGKHANYHLPVAASPADLAIDARALLGALGRGPLAVDLFALSLQPTAWDGRRNGFARGEPSPSDGYGLTLDPDPETAVRRAFGGDARKKLRQKEKRLAESLGPVEHRVAAEAAEVEAWLEAFHAQKAARFAAQGIADPFAEPAARAFLRRACTAGLSEGRPAVELHALVAARDGRVLATYAGAVDGRRFSGMVNSFDADPEVARASPGDQLLLRLVRDQAARGRLRFDLGVGEARYKASLCDETIALVTTLLPVTPRGHLAAAAQRLAGRAKRAVKRRPWAFEAVGRTRRLFRLA